MKRAKRLVILIAALVVVVAALIIFTGRTDEGPAPSEDSSISLAIDRGGISELRWSYQGADVGLKLGGDGLWFYEDDPAFPLDQKFPEAMLSALDALAATTRLSDPGELSDYGLSSPALTVTVTSGGTDTLISIGDLSSVTNTYYLTISTDDSVYMTGDTVVSAFSYGLLQLVEIDTYDSMDEIAEFTIEKDGEAIKIAYDVSEDAVYFYTGAEGNDLPLDTYETTKIKNSILGVSWIECVNYNASPDSLADYGLDDPDTVTVRYFTGSDENREERSVVFQFGSGDAEYRYAKFADSNKVYTVDANKVDQILAADYSSLKQDS